MCANDSAQQSLPPPHGSRKVGLTVLALKRRVGPWVHKSVILTSAWFLLDNLLASLGVKDPGPPRQEHLSGVLVDADIAYSSAVVRNYAKFGPIRGRVAEIGPGGSAATGLFLIESGADQVDLLDRFAYPHDPVQLNQIYSAIISRSKRLTRLFPRVDILSPRIRFNIGEAAAAEIFFQDHQEYDAIYSCAVLEHLFDPIEALKWMSEALKPGGMMVHYIDFRDHAMYTAGGLHELTFLTIPDWIYPAMTRRRGRPNRVLIDQYRALMERLGLEFRILATSLAGVGLIEHMPYVNVPTALRVKAEAHVEQLRHRLVPRYRRMAAADLAIDSIALVATKPVA